MNWLKENKIFIGTIVIGALIFAGVVYSYEQRIYSIRLSVGIECGLEAEIYMEGNVFGEEKRPDWDKWDYYSYCLGKNGFADEW